MQEFRKRWLSLGVAVASGLSVGALAADSELTSTIEPAPAVIQAMATGEGGGGEGEGAATASDLKTDDVAYLSRLGLIRGHLLVGYQLYSQQHAAMAVMHMKHPRDELYAGLVPAIEQRGGKRFDSQLSALAERVTNGADQREVDKAYEALEAGIKAAEERAKPSLKTALLSIKDLVRTAGEEYALGVEDGKLVNAHEYQDSYGFTEIAKRRLANLPADVRSQSPDAVKRVETILNELANLWPGIAPGNSVDGEASRLYSAAAHIEITALGL